MNSINIYIQKAGDTATDITTFPDVGLTVETFQNMMDNYEFPMLVMSLHYGASGSPIDLDGLEAAFGELCEALSGQWDTMSGLGDTFASFLNMLEITYENMPKAIGVEGATTLCPGVTVMFMAPIDEMENLTEEELNERPMMCAFTFHMDDFRQEEDLVLDPNNDPLMHFHMPVMRLDV